MDGRTTLMEACLTGEETIVQLLVQNGANLNACDTLYGWTPLMKAIYHGYTLLLIFFHESWVHGTSVCLMAISSVSGTPMWHYTSFSLVLTLKFVPKMVKLLKILQYAQWTRLFCNTSKQEMWAKKEEKTGFLFYLLWFLYDFRMQEVVMKRCCLCLNDSRFHQIVITNSGGAEYHISKLQLPFEKL